MLNSGSLHTNFWFSLLLTSSVFTIIHIQKYSNKVNFSWCIFVPCSQWRDVKIFPSRTKNPKQTQSVMVPSSNLWFSCVHPLFFSPWLHPPRQFALRRPWTLWWECSTPPWTSTRTWAGMTAEQRTFLCPNKVVRISGCKEWKGYVIVQAVRISGNTEW